MPVSSCRSSRCARRLRRLAWLLAAAVPAAQAHEGPHAALANAAAVAAGWDFTLPTLDGSRFVRLRAADGPVLVNFWGVDCPPCVAELPLLLAFAREHPRWTLLLVGTDPPAAARGFVARLPQALPANAVFLRGATQARALLREAGNPHGGLPYSVALSPAGTGQCAIHAGLLTEAWLSNAAATCTAAPPAKAPTRATPS